jgi:hypothetical protein
MVVIVRASTLEVDRRKPADGRISTRRKAEEWVVERITFFHT